ncbi:hypothetical protein IG193_01850 [Infirmifilum lucidum]|uniref:Phosphoribosyltransferase domain-containing protein n=1 Tax=Infirmifilum lucidum TaxID=2776706 RepID=A0A7L9FHF1_9CREN|nr:phosphoribosyltransferase family protein [Infirmifilum lucidum]QOJ79230.1 hypothetical protein IG193_01850 [Infirmifilum lucidum]
MGSRRVDEVLAQLVCQKALHALRAYVQPRVILEALSARGLELSPVDLSRYLSGSVLPAPEKAYAILDIIYRSGLVGEAFRRAVEVDSQGIVNVPLIAYNAQLLDLAASVAYALFRGRVDVVVTAATNGIPLAALASSFLGTRLAVARRERESPTLKYLEADLLLRDPPSYVHLYMPADMLRGGDRVLIVDDLFRTGRTLRALVNIAAKADARVVGGVSMVALGEAWREAVPAGSEFVALLRL